MADNASQGKAPLLAPVRRKFITDPAGLNSEKFRHELWLEAGDVRGTGMVVPEGVNDHSNGDDIADDLEVAVEDPQTPYVIVGFDLEYTSPLIIAGEEGDHTPLKIHSYQFSAATHDGITWDGIFLPDGDERFTLAEFMLFVFATGARRHGVRQIPNKAFLVGHNAKLTVPLFVDFDVFSQRLSIIQSTVASGPSSIDVQLPFVDGGQAMLKVKLRDTILLVSQASKRLKDVAALLGIEEVQIPPEPTEGTAMIDRISSLRHTDWNLFRRYALNDAEICVKYIQRIISISFEATGKFSVPITLASIGIQLLLTQWEKDKDALKATTDDLLGTETIASKVFDSRFGHMVSKSVVVRKELLHIYEDLITECYHGGRAEQFWFGPSYTAVWSDFDLSSAYPTSMSYIGVPNWDGLRHSYDEREYKLDTLGFALVDFEFPDSVRFPTLPVRAEDGLIFPTRGRSYCSAPEIHLALKLKASVKVVTGVIIPQDHSRPVFSGFVMECIAKRTAAGDGTFDAAFWKEISNTIYGKTAQGLKDRRIFDMKDQASKQMPRSDITNAAYAAYITSFVRAVLGETMNSIPRNRLVFSCSTDGFITDATQSEMDRICQKKLFNIVYGGLREYITGTPDIMKKKHEVTQLIGWRARGQATLQVGHSPTVKRIILAKASIYTVPEMDTTFAQNRFIVDSFLNRNSKSTVTELGTSSIRDLVKYGTDPASTQRNRKLNMEYDWKRRPSGSGVSDVNAHVVFTTDPWETVQQYNDCQTAWDKYNANKIQCIKTTEDLARWSDYLRLNTRSEKASGNHWADKENPELDRLRVSLCRAFKEGKAGVVFPAKVKSKVFAQYLRDAGIPCEDHGINNSMKKAFEPNQCEPNAAVLLALTLLKGVIPTLDASALLYPVDQDRRVIDLGGLPTNVFLQKLGTGQRERATTLKVPAHTQAKFVAGHHAIGDDEQQPDVSDQQMVGTE